MKKILDYDFIKKLKAKYNNLSLKINGAVYEADKNNMVLSFDDNGECTFLDEAKVFNKEYIFSEITSLSLVIKEKEMTDFVYAIELFCEANNLIVNKTHSVYGNELFKPSAQLLLYIIDFELQKYSFDNRLDNGIKANIEYIFTKILEDHNKNNIVLHDGQVLLFAYNFAKLIMMYDNDNSFKKLHNCIMHNSVFENGKLEIPEVEKVDVLNLVVLYFNVVLFCYSQNKVQMQMIIDFINKL